MFGRATIRLGIGPHSSYIKSTDTRCVIITGTPNFQEQNLVNVRFICTKISRPRHEIMLGEVLLELSTACTAFTL